MRKILALAICLLAVATVRSQTPSSDGKAVVYIYAYSAEMNIGGVNKTIYLDDNMIADIRPSRYFIALIEPGTHTFRFSDKKRGGIEKDFQAGEIYYLRVDWTIGARVKPAGLILTPPENGAYDVKQLKPIDKNRSKNTSIVVFDLK